MKFTLAAIIASTGFTASLAGSTPDGQLDQGETCTVTWKTNTPGTTDAHYEEYDPVGDGSGLCIGGNGQTGLACNFQLADDGQVPDGEPIHGTCEPKSCMGSNSRAHPETSSHRITICHRTCSPTNPWVRITIDDDAWAGTELCGHGVQHDIEQDCNGRTDWTPWGDETHDHVLRDHGTRGSGSREYVNYLNGWESNSAEEKEYWKKWEKACPYVRNGACCDIAAGECCTGSTETTTTTTAPPPETTTETTTVAPPANTEAPNTQGGGGGDPHFQRWGQEHDSFHGECDLVMIHSDEFHNGAGFDLQARTKIQDYFSYIESMAMKIGNNRLEFHKDHFYLDDVMYTPADLPLTFGDDLFTVENAPIDHGKNADYYQYYKVDLHEKSSVLFKFYKKFLTFEISGHPADFADSVGLMGEFNTGDMIGRDGRMIDNFDEYGFEWQVTPSDNALFRDTTRAPQLPYEKCRMPTGARPARRHLRSNMALFEQAQEACAHISGKGLDLCVDDVLTTGDLGLASLW